MYDAVSTKKDVVDFGWSTFTPSATVVEIFGGRWQLEKWHKNDSSAFHGNCTEKLNQPAVFSTWVYFLELFDDWVYARRF